MRNIVGHLERSRGGVTLRTVSSFALLAFLPGVYEEAAGVLNRPGRDAARFILSKVIPKGVDIESNGPCHT